MKTAQKQLELIKAIGLTPSMRKKINHARTRWAGDTVMIPTDAVEVVQNSRVFINSLGQRVERKFKILVWIELNEVYYTEI